MKISQNRSLLTSRTKLVLTVLIVALSAMLGFALIIYYFCEREQIHIELLRFILIGMVIVISSLAVGFGIAWWIVSCYPFFGGTRKQLDVVDEITECKRLETALRESNQLLHAIVENMPAMVFMKRADNLRFELLNRTGEIILGYSRGELLGKNDYDFFPQEQADAFTAEDRKVLASEGARKIRQEPVKTSSGETRYLSTKKIAIRNAAGEPTHLLGISLDISASKLTEETLRATSLRLEKSERFIRAVTDNLPAMVSYWDADLICHFANSQYKEWFGASPEQMIGRKLPEFLGYERFPAYESRFRRVLLGERQDFERTMTKPSGEVGHVWASYIPDFDDNGGVLGFYVLVSDVTALKRAEEAQRVAANAFGAHEGMIIMDANKVIVKVNRAFTEISGYASEEAVGRTPHFFRSGRHDDAFYIAMYETLHETGHWKGEVWHRRKNGEVFPEWATITAIKTEDGEITHFVVTLTDITARKEAEERSRIAATAFEAHEGMIIMDANQVILKVNRAFTEISGYTSDEAVGRTPHFFRSGRHDSAFYTTMFEILNATGHWKGEVWHRRKNGEVFPDWATITAIKAEGGAISYMVVTLTDITARKELEERNRMMAFYDPLTNLPNRRLLMDRLQKAIPVSARTGRSGALMFIDLDNFKTLNDTLGHDNGDLLLQQVASRLLACVRESDTVARLGGDEFVVLLEELSGNYREAKAQSQAIGSKILDALNELYLLARHSYHCSPSIGVAVFNGRDHMLEKVMKQADLAMYEAKAAGRNTLRFFESQIQDD